MSDIYLQITETPTVVTLSAPVISGALSSTVTVANVVSVNVVTMPAITVQASTPSVTTVAGTVTVGNSITIGQITSLQGQNLLGSQGVFSTLRLKDSGGTYGEPSGSGINTYNLPVYGTVTIGAGTQQIGSVTASISGTVTANVPVLDQSIRDGILLFNQTEGNIGVAVNYAEPITGTVTIGSLPAISGTVTANTFALQGTTVTTSNFTSTTASTVLANFNATREVLTIFNEGAGNLHICAGATCTTIAYQVRLSAGDYYEVPNHQTTITHSAVFATAGTARVCQVS
jgi:hypothetical protein